MRHFRPFLKFGDRCSVVATTAAAFAGLLACCALAACSGSAGGAGEGAGELRVERGAVAPSMLLTGELVASDSLRLIAPNVEIWPLQIRWIAEEGDPVKAGDSVVEFDNSQLTANLESLRSDVVAAANELSQARSRAASDEAAAFFAFEEAKAAWEKARLEAALPKDLGAEQEWARRQLELEKAAVEKEDARVALETTREESAAAVDIARLALRKAERALRQAEEGLEAVVLTAPRDGIVLVETNGREGRTFRSGDTAWPGMTIATLPDLSTLEVEAVLFDVDDGRVAPGMDVVATLDAFPGERLPGEIQRVTTIAEQERRSARRAFRVLVDVEGVDPERMRPGMSVKVEATLPAREGLVVPRGALAFSDPASSQDGPPRLRLADGSWAEVEVGICDAFFCLLEDGGGVVGEGTRLASADGLEDAGTGVAEADHG